MAGQPRAGARAADAQPRRGHVSVGRGSEGGSGADSGLATGLGSRGRHRRPRHRNLPGNIATGRPPSLVPPDPGGAPVPPHLIRLWLLFRRNGNRPPPGRTPGPRARQRRPRLPTPLHRRGARWRHLRQRVLANFGHDHPIRPGHKVRPAGPRGHHHAIRAAGRRHRLPVRGGASRGRTLRTRRRAAARDGRHGGLRPGLWQVSESERGLWRTTLRGEKRYWALGACRVLEDARAASMGAPSSRHQVCRQEPLLMRA
mmetsp:Transcript_11177/g.37047  ORF Transcript_11177/g.37047 Transcript_11177/m.37047 type:complete len:257 (+) Transcript_11177:1180-1950(+)